MMEVLSMKNRITSLFASRPGNLLSVFYTAGFPALDDTVKVAGYLQNAGADILEIGIPFSDPVADGPTIQESNRQALENGISVAKILEQVAELRKTVSLPVVLMGYLNPVMQYGIERFCKDAAEAGVDGVILPDMPVDEFSSGYRALFEAHQLSHSFLISPTTSEQRIRYIDSITSGFIYAVSASSTTGARGTFTAEQIRYFERLKEMQLSNPFLIGFGISNHETFSAACRYGSGGIIGSAFINLLKSSKNPEHDIRAFVRGLRNAV